MKCGTMNNKLLLVTGGNQGIGKSIVIEALNSGYKVAFTYITLMKKRH